MGLSKTKKSLYGVPALALILGFGLAACDGSSPASGNNGGGNGFTYHTVTFIDNYGAPTAQTLSNVRHGTNLSLAGHIDGIDRPTRAHDTPLARAWALGWAEDPDAAATLSYIVVTRDATLYAVWRDVELRFWWGNYIPAYGSILEEYGFLALLNTPSGDFWGSFDLDELIAEKENSRLVGAHDLGWGTEWIGLGHQEGKHASAAVRRTAPDFRSEIFNPTMGFSFFIYPTSFGQVDILTAGNDNINHLFDFPEVDIDGLLYTVAHLEVPLVTNSNMEFRFQWN